MKFVAMALVVVFCVPVFAVNALAQTPHWADEAVVYVCEQGIMQTQEDGSFDYDKPISGAEFVTAINNMIGEAAQELVDSTIIPSDFNDEDNLTRASMAEIAYNYAVSSDKDLEPQKELVQFGDLTDITAEAKAAIEMLQQVGVINGRPEGVFDPLGEATWAEAATVLRAVSQLSNKEDGDEELVSNWWDALPRTSWSYFQEIEVKNDWFSVYQMPGNVYALYEDGQWQEVISYLIIGEEKALLWDTGMGIGDIKACAEELTDLPIFVVNSHSHMDHIGGNWQFDEIYVYDSPAAVEKLTEGNTHDKVIGELEGGSVWKEFPEGFDPEAYVTVGKAPTGVLVEGDIIDLGNRQLEVLHTPGHSADSIMLIDEGEGIIFTGDTYYPASLYAFSDDSDLGTYVDSMKKVAAKVKDMDIAWIYASHNEVWKGTEILGQVAECMEQIYTGQRTEYEMNEWGLRLFLFDNDIKIITLDEDYGQ